MQAMRTRRHAHPGLEAHAHAHTCPHAHTCACRSCRCCARCGRARPSPCAQRIYIRRSWDSSTHRTRSQISRMTSSPSPGTCDGHCGRWDVASSEVCACLCVHVLTCVCVFMRARAPFWPCVADRVLKSTGMFLF